MPGGEKKQEQEARRRMADNPEKKSPEERRKELFRNQKQLLDTFLEHGAISRAQYEKSLGDLIVKMGIREENGD